MYSKAFQQAATSTCLASRLLPPSLTQFQRFSHPTLTHTTTKLLLMLSLCWCWYA